MSDRHAAARRPHPPLRQRVLPALPRRGPDRPLARSRRLSGWLAERDGRVWLERGCPDHGLVRTLYDESPEILRYLEQWTAPTKAHVPDVAGNFAPGPGGLPADGLPEMQTQHTCILLADITDHCNLRCPTCFTDSSPAISPAWCRCAEVLASVDTRLSRENGRIDVLMLSGGEPTLYPQLAELLDARWRARPIVRVLVNTNGVAHRPRRRAARPADPRTASGSRSTCSTTARRPRRTATTAAPTCAGSRSRPSTGCPARGHLHHADDDRRAGRQRRRDRRGRQAGARHPVRRRGLDPAAVRLRAARARSTRCDRLTHTGVLARLGPQTGGLVTWRDLTALPCSHPHCCSVGYLLRDDAGQWRSLTALIGARQLLSFLDLAPDAVANRIADTELPADAARGGQGVAARPALGAVVAVAPAGRRPVARHLRELRPRHLDADDAGVVGAARRRRAAAPDARRAGQADHGQAVHGHGAR